MAEVRVIARSVARSGKQDQLRELLRAMLAPTRAERVVRCMNSIKRIRQGVFTFTKYGKARLRSISTRQALTLNICSKVLGNSSRRRSR